jgi:predicted RNA polymerase sigma factor
MLLTDVRRPSGTDSAGDLITKEHQNRDQWDSTLIAEGAALITDAMRHRQVWPYQLQAAIAAVHNGAPSYSETDWPQIATLYAWFGRLTPTSPSRLSRVVAVANRRPSIRRSRARWRHAIRRAAPAHRQ